jgi:hypothetical protein
MKDNNMMATVCFLNKVCKNPKYTEHLTITGLMIKIAFFFNERLLILGCYITFFFIALFF